LNFITNSLYNTETSTENISSLFTGAILKLSEVEATGLTLDNIKMAATDTTDTFQLKYCSLGVKQHPLTLFAHATLAIK
jgi:hypothetical protein